MEVFMDSTETEAAREIWRVQRKQTLCLGYADGRLIAVPVWTKYIPVFSRSLIATTADDFFECGFARFQMGQLTKDECIRLGEWFTWCISVEHCRRKRRSPMLVWFDELRRDLTA
jgi:hypothetical protein